MSANPYIEQLLQQRFGSDPYWQMLQQLLQPPSPDDTEPSGVHDTSDREKTAREALLKARRYIRKLKARIAILEKERTELAAAEAEMAQALGACIQCWGENPYCPACQGQGVPGSQNPDPLLFEQLVLPALRRRQRNSER